MDVRSQTTHWQLDPKRLYGVRLLSPTDHAWNTRAEQELVRYSKKHFGVVYLDCSKCYERAPRRQASEKARSTGCPYPIVNLVFGLYEGDRRLSVHSAISQRCGGAAGLIVGCGFAVHILKAYLDLEPIPLAGHHPRLC